MAAKLGGGDDDAITDINVTPLVDIMLVLLIIFMLTSEAVTKKVKNPAIDVDLPTAASGEDKPEEPLSVVINKEGALFLNGKELKEADLRAKVKARVLLRGKAKVEAVLSADKGLSHGRVVRLIDMLRVLGVQNVAINTKEQEIQ
ncbi:MAG: biopolymer transporter ExbD [Myxococcales bacterium]|nr:biopolymer transporter ExbD [Myxococcales bacterium]